MRALSGLKHAKSDTPTLTQRQFLDQNEEILHILTLYSSNFSWNKAERNPES